MRCLLIIAVAALAGCSKSPSPAQPEPVRLDRKFFDDKGDPAKQRPMPKPK